MGKLKTWHWVAIAAFVGIIIWAVVANKKKKEEERLEEIRRAQNLPSLPPSGSKLADILNAIFPFFEKATDKVGG